MNGNSGKKTVNMPRCPVPADQVPIKEYESMSASWFFRWGAQDLRQFLVPVVGLWLASWLVVGPMAAVSFGPDKLLPKFVISASLGALLLPTLALIQLYTGWRHVCDRLSQESVPYEESGWYDGQVWDKPQSVIDRDRLIADYQVKPVLHRLQKTFAVICGIVAFGLVTFQFV